ncbi:methyltransferase domain-containing protein [Kribbella qitaiheensis]|uniref:Methyltransferase domain-containing protein n=1 Tax=Kribbella qitaiheensis TaxID=1544730 RepID=A0A7G6X8A9_9ACTN|nr:methyltransferase [Kribbella qitaiheensis]QNE22474.1 methyltransferase domain-containing protein [Kribbella qitaiheensis]
MSSHTTTGHGHGHGHGHGDTDIDWEAMATNLESHGELHLPALRSTAARLRELLGPSARRSFDVGSGPGMMTCVFAEAFPDGEAVAIDPTLGLLDRALARAERLGLNDRVTVRQAELPGLDDGTLGQADLVWSSKAVHHLGDQQAAVTELASVLRPAGVLAIAEGGLPMRYLPRDIGIGRPGLQARLDAVQEDWFGSMRDELPGSTKVVEDWPAMLTRAGLTDVGSFTTLLDLPAPLTAAARAYLHATLTRLHDTMSESLADDDRHTLGVLLDPNAPEGILHRPDAFLLTATTVFTGRKSR